MTPFPGSYEDSLVLFTGDTPVEGFTLGMAGGERQPFRYGVFEEPVFGSGACRGNGTESWKGGFPVRAGPYTVSTDGTNCR